MEVLLVVEDARLRDLLIVGLDQVGNVSWSATTCRSARERFRQRRFDVVIIDLDAESDEVHPLVETFRKGTQDVEIVVITQSRPARYISQSGDSGRLVHFVQKPVDIKSFFYLLARLKKRLRAGAEPAGAR